METGAHTELLVDDAFWTTGPMLKAPVTATPAAIIVPPDMAPNVAPIRAAREQHLK
jgi:hypothetical protein